MATALEELGGRLDAKLAEIDALFAKKNDAGEYTWGDEDFAARDALEKECKEIRGKYEVQAKLDAGAREIKEARTELARVRRPVPFGDGSVIMQPFHVGSPPTLDHATASAVLAKMVTDHPDFQHGRRSAGVRVTLKDFDFGTVVLERKTVLSTSAGFGPYPQRTGVVVPYALRRPVVADLIPQDPTTQPSILYMEQTTNTNNAAPVAEGGSKPEGAFAWTQRTQPLEVIAEVLPVTEQQLDDVPEIERIIRGELTTHLMLAEEEELINGTGVSPRLQGFLTKSGLQTRAAGTEPTPNVILRGMTDVAVTGRAAANGIVMHPTNYLNMRLLQTADGIYIFGSPTADADVSIWGMRPVVTDAMTLNTVLLGDFLTYSHISRRRGITIDIGFVNDDFKRNQRTIRAELREALEIRRAAAFVKLTGVA